MQVQSVHAGVSNEAALPGGISDRREWMEMIVKQEDEEKHQKIWLQFKGQYFWTGQWTGLCNSRQLTINLLHMKYFHKTLNLHKSLSCPFPGRYAEKLSLQEVKESLCSYYSCQFLTLVRCSWEIHLDL